MERPWPLSRGRVLWIAGWDLPPYPSGNGPVHEGHWPVPDRLWGLHAAAEADIDGLLKPSSRLRRWISRRHHGWPCRCSLRIRHHLVWLEGLEQGEPARRLSAVHSYHASARARPNNVDVLLAAV